MKIEILPDPAQVARRAAAVVAAEARVAATERGRFVLAVSGGSTPWAMLRALAAQDLPWEALHVVQVDERVVPPDAPERNLRHLRESLLCRAPLDPGRIHAMPVDEPDLEAAAARYQRELEAIAGRPAVLDGVHLGLGADGHTASLVPGDPGLDAADRDVAVTGVYQGYRRMTLTFPILNRARLVLWLVTGAAKAEALARVVRGDPNLPAGRVRAPRSLLVADAAAAAQLPRSGTDHPEPTSAAPGSSASPRRDGP